MKSEFGWGCESPKTPIDPLRGKHKYSYQMEIAKKWVGYLFLFLLKFIFSEKATKICAIFSEKLNFTWVKMSHRITVDSESRKLK